MNDMNKRCKYFETLPKGVEFFLMIKFKSLIKINYDKIKKKSEISCHFSSIPVFLSVSSYAFSAFSNGGYELEEEEEIGRMII